MKVYVLLQDFIAYDQEPRIIGVYSSHEDAVEKARSCDRPIPWYSIAEYETETGEMTAEARCVDYSK